MNGQTRVVSLGAQKPGDQRGPDAGRETGSLVRVMEKRPLMVRMGPRGYRDLGKYEWTRGRQSRLSGEDEAATG